MGKPATRVLEKMSSVFPNGQGSSIKPTEIRTRSVCVNINPETTTTLTQKANRFDPPPARCPQCRGTVNTDPQVRVRVGCYWEKIG